jgi:hypothetical protein
MVTGATLLGACSPSGIAVTSQGKLGASQGPLSGSPEPLRAPYPVPAPYVAVKPSPGAPPLDFGEPIASVEAVLSNHGRQRVDGETAARDIAKLLLDSRTSRSGEEVLGLISSPALAPATRAGLIGDYDRTSARGGNLQRHCEPGAGAYARSSFEGPAGQPTRVSFNFACFLSSVPMKIGFWYVTSYDVVSSPGGGWQLAEAGFGKGTLIGVTGSTMTAAEKSKLLVGPGWRRLSP